MIKTSSREFFGYNSRLIYAIGFLSFRLSKNLTILLNDGLASPNFLHAFFSPWTVWSGALITISLVIVGS